MYSGQAATFPQSAPVMYLNQCSGTPVAEEHWYAVYTYPQHEKSCMRQLMERGVDVFLPTYTQERVWKNRQRVTLQVPLFPSYLFVRVSNKACSTVMRAPGVLRMLGNVKGPEPIPDGTIELLRSDLFRGKVEVQQDMVAGQRVRIKHGVMQGIEGVLVRKKNSLWFVLSIDLINQSAMVEVSAEDVQPVEA